jgi:hypothetical protein
MSSHLVISNITLILSVYLSKENEIEFKLQESEIASVKWVPLSFFESSNEKLLKFKKILNFSMLDYSKNMKKYCPSFLSFPVQLHGVILPDSNEWSKNEIEVQNEFILWGLTLKITHEMMFYLSGERKQLCSDKLHSNNAVLSILLNHRMYLVPIFLITLVILLYIGWKLFQ